MNSDVSVDALLEVLRRFYPLKSTPRDPRREASDETLRLRSHIIDTIFRTSGAWNRFIQRVEAAFSDCDVSCTYPMESTPSYQCHVTLPGMQPRQERTQESSVTGMVSLVAPVYALYARYRKDDGTERESWLHYPPLPAEFQAHEATLAALIETSFNVTRVPNEVLFTRDPHLLHPYHPYVEPWLVELLF